MRVSNLVLCMVLMLFLLAPALWFFSNMLRRTILVEGETIVDRHGIFKRSHSIHRGTIASYRIEEDTRLSARWAVGSILGVGFIPKHASRKIILLGQDGGTVAKIDTFGFSDATVKQITAVLTL